MNYVYLPAGELVFLYLVQERHFTVLESGWLVCAPPFAAAIGAGVGGHLASVFGARYGVRKGCALSRCCHCRPQVCFSSSRWSLHAYVAVTALALCYFLLKLNEAPYWAAIMHVVGRTRWPRREFSTPGATSAA